MTIRVASVKSVSKASLLITIHCAEIYLNKYGQFSINLVFLFKFK